MISRQKLRMTGEPPYSPAVPDELADAPPSPPLRPAPEPEREILSPEEVDIMAALEEQQRADDARESIGKAILAGFAAAFVCVVFAGGFAALTGYWQRTFCVVIGLGVALAVKQFGRGDDRRFGCVGAFWSLAGCVGAHHFALAMLFARHYGGSFGAFPFLDLTQDRMSLGEWVNETVRWSDLFFYALAAFCGYRFSQNALAERY